MKAMLLNAAIWTLSRLEEKSTWVGIITMVATIIGHEDLPVQVSDVVVVVGPMLAAGLMAVTTKTAPAA
ncbi:MAG: hypothetical protein V4457_12885 [Pseudomonadota bacterium]